MSGIVPLSEADGKTAGEWAPAVIEAPHAIPEPAEIVYGTPLPVPMQVPDRAARLSAAGRA